MLHLVVGSIRYYLFTETSFDFCLPSIVCSLKKLKLQTQLFLEMGPCTEIMYIMQDKMACVYNYPSLHVGVYVCVCVCVCVCV